MFPFFNPKCKFHCEVKPRVNKLSKQLQTIHKTVFNLEKKKKRRQIGCNKEGNDYKRSQIKLISTIMQRFFKKANYLMSTHKTTIVKSDLYKLRNVKLIQRIKL